MKVRDIMTAGVQMVTPGESITNVARCMADNDIGSVFVHENDRLIGVVTDRDIATRAVAKGKLEGVCARDVMTDAVCYCFEDESIEDVSQNMADIELRRLPVVNRDKRLVGVISLGNIAAAHSQRASSTLLEGVARPH
jgi:CBS domain-containing protein